jgi:hypothetical protein
VHTYKNTLKIRRLNESVKQSGQKVPKKMKVKILSSWNILLFSLMLACAERVQSLKIALFTPGISKSHVLFSHRLAQTLVSLRILD